MRNCVRGESGPRPPAPGPAACFSSLRTSPWNAAPKLKTRPRGCWLPAVNGTSVLCLQCGATGDRTDVNSQIWPRTVAPLSRSRGHGGGWGVGGNHLTTTGITARRGLKLSTGTQIKAQLPSKVPGGSSGPRWKNPLLAVFITSANFYLSVRSIFNCAITHRFILVILSSKHATLNRTEQ